MATASAVLCATAATACISGGRARWKAKRVVYVPGLNSFGGLKAHNSLASLGFRESSEQRFAKLVCSLTKASRGRGLGGGAFSSTCDAGGEIFKIAAIMNGLVLIGVAVGFVLLGIEAKVEESE